MYDVEDFEKVFEHGGYSSGLVSDIQENQHVLGGRTFFERLLELLGIKWRRIYPPKDDDTLFELHKRLISAPISLHYKHCLVFYLLKDLSSSTHGDVELASAFASEVHLDERFWTFIEGIWELDHLQFETAVGKLTYPGLIPTFPDEILMALLSRGERMGVGGREGGLDALPLAYFECVKPPLATEAVRTKFATYLSHRNVTETYYWIRTRPDHEHYTLLEILFEQTLTHSSANNTAIYPREDKAEELVSLPFTEDEEQWAEHFLTEGRGRALKGAEDTVALRRLASGRFVEFAREGGSKGRKFENVNWEILRDGVRRGLGPRTEEEGFRI